MMIRILAPMMIMAVFAGCAKKKEYDKLHIDNPEAHIKKSVIESMCSSIDDPCIYVPSVENTPYNITASRPFSLGDQKLVVARIDKNEVKFLQIEEDERFNENINNFSPVLSLPVEHKHYKCKEDDYGDCTNTEEEDTERHWSKRKYVQINLDAIDVKEVNLLPIQLGEMFQKGCFSTLGQEVKSFKVEKDAINFVITKTYKAAGKSSCITLEEAEDLRYAVFTIDYGYSIAKLSTLADQNYVPVDYPSRDEAHFGFFKSELKKKSVDNHDTVMGLRKSILNRWSPNKKEVVYYLNEEFYKPENKVVLDSTYQAIESVNNSLRKANAGFVITLKDGRGKSISDIRNNFIIFVKDPQASGVIGYGPSVANPRTGEILNARTVMYYGTIVKFVSSTYDDLVDEQKAKLSEANNPEQEKEKVASANGNELQLLALGHNHVHEHVEAHFSADTLAQIHSNDVLIRDHDYLANILGDVFERPLDLQEIQTYSHEFEKKIAEMAKQTFFHASQINFDDAMVQALENQVANNEELKKWDDLSEQERGEVIKKLLPFIWVPTLVHEFGHNLGLRHNFAGSTDEANYYTNHERRAMGMNRPVTYSSIMDYAYKQTNELPIMGKYDVAALRFAYAREVEDKAGNFVKIDSTINEALTTSTSGKKLSLKSYAYCSDEHVGTDPVCNRFDEGRTSSEVAKHYVDSFVSTYEKRNFRGRRYSYNGRSGDLQYLISLFNRFASLRNFFEIYDQKKFQGAYDEPKPEELPELMDIKKAADIAFDFYMDVLETPAYHCAVKDLESDEFVAVRPFVEFAKNAGISFDLKNGCGLFNQPGSKYRFYEFGKYFNNALDIKVDRSQVRQGDTSELDVRGVWMDKAIATMFLSMRLKQPTTIGTKSNGNFLDYPEYRERFMAFADGLLKNQFVSEVELSDGNKVVGKLQVPFSFDDSHFVNASYNGVVNAIFGLKDTKTDFKQVFLGQLKENLKEVANEGELELDDSLYSQFHVDQVSIRRNLSDFNYNHVVEFKRKNGTVAYRFGFYDYNTKAVELMLLKKQLALVEGLKPEALQVVFNVFRSGNLNLPEEAPAELKKLVNDLLMETLTVMLSGRDQDGDGKPDPVVLEELPEQVKTIATGFVASTLMKVLTGALDKSVLLHSFIALSK